MSAEKNYVVWYTGNYNGDCVIWWGPDRSGYVTDLDKAGRYTEEEAKSIEAMRGKERAIPLKVAEAAVCRHVTSPQLYRSLEAAGLVTPEMHF